jgi:hypothetical protein
MKEAGGVRLKGGEMKQLLVLVAAGSLLSGCASMEPYQTGQDRYEMNYRGGDGAGAEKAQAFCRKRGYDFATINYENVGDIVVVGHASFLCSHNGDTITYPPAPAVVLVPDFMPAY